MRTNDSGRDDVALVVLVACRELFLINLLHRSVGRRCRRRRRRRSRRRCRRRRGRGAAIELQHGTGDRVREHTHARTRTRTGPNLCAGRDATGTDIPASAAHARPSSRIGE